jgi:hypothetical protein
VLVTYTRRPINTIASWYCFVRFFEGLSVMCCFTVSVREVSGTFILVAPVVFNRQLVVYHNHVELAAPAVGNGPRPAMILPFPTRPDGEVRLLDLSQDDSFFHDLSRSFPTFKRGLANSSTSSTSGGGRGRHLAVEQVGGYKVRYSALLLKKESI